MQPAANQARMKCENTRFRNNQSKPIKATEQKSLTALFLVTQQISL